MQITDIFFNSTRNKFNDFTLCKYAVREYFALILLYFYSFYSIYLSTSPSSSLSFPYIACIHKPIDAYVNTELKINILQY